MLKSFKEGTSKEQKDALLNAIRLYDGRSKITRLFENKDIEPSDYPHNAKSEPEESEPKEYEESIAERTKIRRQKKI